MEVVPLSGETPRVGRANHQPYYFQRNKRSVWKREGDTTVKPERNDNRKEKLCKFWASGNCVKGDRCPFLHSWSHGDHVSIIATLQGHTQAVTGIAYPSGGDKLYSGSMDGTLRVWNCHTGQCERVIDLGAEVCSLIQEGPWIFVGLPNLVKAWNTQRSAEFSLDGPVGQVYAMIFDKNILFAGTQNGQILAWKVSPENETTTNPFQPAHVLEGHNQGIECLTIGRNMLYSGSFDGTIKKWDLGTLQCLATAKGHSRAVMSLACWDNYLVSCSLDGTIKAWGATQDNGVEVCYTHEEKQGVLALGGMSIPVIENEEERHDILFCSCDDNSVHLYELPSFQKKGRVFTRQEARSIHFQDGNGGLFFIGDGTGLITVGKMTC
ncbi:hypothetical protein TIFTF001_042533 [Ficus carica]|uniref:C3H1-type domain-containing protein n=1 Tax=Ficus carica TaxID=3494 RepID=A0AA87ZMT2_FICCA|nr:hypothetical protein TIFTF001_042533 [Ficus carica]